MTICLAGQIPLTPVAMMSSGTGEERQLACDLEWRGETPPELLIRARLQRYVRPGWKKCLELITSRVLLSPPSSLSTTTRTISQWIVTLRHTALRPITVDSILVVPSGEEPRSRDLLVTLSTYETESKILSPSVSVPLLYQSQCDVLDASTGEILAWSLPLVPGRNEWHVDRVYKELCFRFQSLSFTPKEEEEQYDSKRNILSSSTATTTTSTRGTPTSSPLLSCTSSFLICPKMNRMLLQTSIICIPILLYRTRNGVVSFTKS